MKFWKQTLPFLLLNILVSAATVVAVVYFFGPRILAFAEARQSPAAAAPLAQSSNSDAPAPAQPASVNLNLVIAGVFGAGDLNAEYIQIRNQGKATANLLNWTLSGSKGQLFSFPDLSLKQSGTVNIHSKTGDNSALDLYFNSSASLWERGEILSLKDASGKLQTSFQVP